MTTHRWDKWRSVAIGLAVACVGILGIHLVWGGFSMVWTPDSVRYVAAAESLQLGHGLVYIDGGAYTLWPPGYPSALAIGLWAFGNPDVPALIINLIAYIAVVTVSTVVIRRVVESQRLRWIGTIAVAISPPMVLTTIHVWSDSIFAALTVGALALLLFGLDQRGRRLLVTAAVVAGLSVLVRYLGIVSVFVGIGAIVLVGNGSWRRRASDSAFFALVALGIGVVPLARNMSRSGEAIADRVSSCVELLTPIGGTFESLAQWFALDLGQIGGILVLFAALVAAVVGWRCASARVTKLAIVVFGSFIVVYIVALVVGSAIYDIDPPGARLLLPVYAPIVLLTAVAVDSIIGHGKFSDSRRRVRILIAVVFAVLVIAPMAYVVAVSTRFGETDRHDARDSAAALSILDADPPETELLVSNRPYLVYLRWGDPVGLSPRTETCALQQPHTHFLDAAGLKRLAFEHGSVTLVWVGAHRVHFENDDGYRVTRVDETDDGSIIHVRPVRSGHSD